jgi:hypothetical protein
MKIFIVIFVCLFSIVTFSREIPPNRVASVLVAEDFINSQLSSRVKSELIKSMGVVLDPDHEQIYLRGLLQIPVDELRAINLEPNYGAFQFQATIKLEVTKKGYLILEFPLTETFLYPADSKTPGKDKIIVPVQLLSVALASARGYLAALSGDFSGFDKRTKKLTVLIKDLDLLIRKEKNSDALDELKNQRQALKLQLQAVPVERRQLQGMSKQVQRTFGLTGEKELNLNQDLGARRNALVLKLQLSQLAPYLKNVELGGLRIFHDAKDGEGQNYFAIDINSTSEGTIQASSGVKNPHTPMKTPPSLIIRLNQSLFESDAIKDVEKKDGGSKIRNLDFKLKDDGVHVTGDYHFLIMNIGFDTVVDFVTTAPDVFEVRLRDIKIEGLDFEFLSKFILAAVKKRFDHAMKDICTFEDLPKALRVTVDAKKLVPAFPDLHLLSVDIREREFLLKIGKP